jgi:hypothetical protein
MKRKKEYESEEALAIPKLVDIHDDAVITARDRGISFGDS